ncbi:hypothetical protein ACGFSD_26770 [Streptomyces caniferus]|uniref:hypothetical protein n=1 Tax=Streptomyces caniferus TaxID=285557 RepID=UPI003718D4EA
MSGRARHRTNEEAKTVLVIADLPALILGLWILLALLDAHRANDLVNFAHIVAGWLAGRSHDPFTMDTDWVRTG